MRKQEIKRQSNVRGKILDALRHAGNIGLTNVQLSKIGVRYGGHLGDLYKRGYVVDKENLGDGVYNYILVSEPEEEVIEHKSALDMLIEGVNKLGLVDGRESKC
jgi:hypothetical protein